MFALSPANNNDCRPLIVVVLRAKITIRGFLGDSLDKNEHRPEYTTS